jgi:hypothetical protein
VKQYQSIRCSLKPSRKKEKSSFDLELGVALEVRKEEELVAKILNAFSTLSNTGLNFFLLIVAHG